MTADLFAFIGLGIVVVLWSLLGYRIIGDGKGMGSADVGPGRDEGRGGLMDRIARWVVLGLGRLTFFALHTFKKLGVDVATIDQALADWTSYASELKSAKAASDAHASELQTALEAALADAQTLRDTDAAEDAADADRLKASVADQIAAALELAKNPPAQPEPPADVPADPAPPVTPDPEPTGGDATPPVPFDPTATPDVPADVPVDVPVTEVPADPEVPADSLDPRPDEPVADPTAGQ